MTAREIRERLAFAIEIHDSLVAARKAGVREEIRGLEKAIKVLTDMVMEMGRDDDESSGKTSASASEISSTKGA